VSHKYDDAVISALYQDTNIAIKVGDRVLMHGKRKGTVVDILNAKTDSAKDYSCYDAGGLLLQMVEKLDDSAQ
jgi:wobble nucleotide-excising tRNase